MSPIPTPELSAREGVRPFLMAVLLGLLLALISLPARAVLPIEHWTTAAGARVYFVRAPAIPMLDIAVVFDAGKRLDPPGKAGLAGLVADMLDAGVPGADEEVLAGALADSGAQRSAGAADDRSMVTLRTLTSEAELTAALRLLERTLAEPLFPDAVLARERERLVQALREAQTKPETLAQQAFGRLLFGAHPYGEYATEASISAIQAADLRDFYRRHYGASRAVVAIIGDIDQARARAIAEQLTARLPRGEPAPVLPAVPKPAGQDRRIEHPASQSHLMIGTTAIAWGDPDQFALLVGNHVLGGGGFVSRLYGEVREQRGLAYGVFSAFQPRQQPGPFLIGLQTQRDQTEAALKVVRDTVRAFVRDGPTEAELSAAKANLIGGFPLRIDSNRKILENLANIGVNRLPLDYLERWSERVQAVTVAQIRAAFERHISPDGLVTVVVGAGGPPP